MEYVNFNLQSEERLSNRSKTLPNMEYVNWNLIIAVLQKSFIFNLNLQYTKSVLP
jgi:hypothetical protein